MASNSAIHVPDELNEQFLRSLLNALPPGGTVCVEKPSLKFTFSKAQDARDRPLAIGPGTSTAEGERASEPGPSTSVAVVASAAASNGRSSANSTPVKRKLVFDSLPLTPAKRAAPGSENAVAHDIGNVVGIKPGNVIARLLWRYFKITPLQKLDLLHLTFLDEDHNQFTAVVFEEGANKWREYFVKDRIYEISGVTREKKTEKDVTYSRLKDQDYKMAISSKTVIRDVTETASEGFPRFQMSFAKSYNCIAEKPVCNVIGWVVESNLADEGVDDKGRKIVLRNQLQETMEINVSTCFSEIKDLGIFPHKTILALIGIEADGNHSELRAKTFQDTIVQVIYSIDYVQ